MKTNKKTSKGVEAVQMKEQVANSINSDIQALILKAKENIGVQLTFDERVYLWNDMLKEFGIKVLTGGKSTPIVAKKSWLKQAGRWLKSLTNKFKR